MTLVNADGEVVEVALADLRYGPNVRDERLDLDHVARLTAVIDACPPIVVQAGTMKVLDGFHRWNAANRLDRKTIRAVIVECPDLDALELAVSANTTHGMPLTVAERKRAAREFIESTDWSDRRIASSCGLTHETVGELRPRATGGNRQLRTGRDGKQRPVNVVERRERAAEVITEKPEASDREVAARSGLSPRTVADVRRRQAAGSDPVPPKLRSVPPASTEVRVGDVVTSFPVKGRWAREECITTNEARDFARWMDRNLPDDKRAPADVVASCPADLAAGAVDAAKAAAAYWTQIADVLTRRGLTAVEAK